VASAGFDRICDARFRRAAVVSSLAVAAELSAGTLRAVPVTGVDLTLTLRAVWTEGRRLTGPALDLYAIAARRSQ